ncbi:hypothetical protein [Burkholderia sp. L27(2015)]|uniref:hypothetical protein n=1 Tax=Burkholderia sp. L27(2015) TaxID=1641858 RepID=UPI00131DA047|nr:hypothetical protein [Burkholderia sp. L27(2015)]
MRFEVYYLSFYPPYDGFLFPDELPPTYYAPGLFLVEETGDGLLPYSYEFEAMDNGQRVTLTMVRNNEGDVNSNLYVVKTKYYGSFWFSIERLNPRLKYLGKRLALSAHRALSVAVTRDANKLERTCERFDFYFIGTTLREPIEQT